MNRSLGLPRVAHRRERLLQQLLQVRLADVDDVVGRAGAAEGRMRRRVVRGLPTSSPRAAGRRRAWQRAGNEVPAEQAELPELVRDVFADVGDGAVRAHDDLLASLIIARRVRRASACWRQLARARADSPSSIAMTQQPASRPSVCRYTVPCCLRISKARAQNCRRRMSPSQVSRSYSMCSRAMVSRCAADDRDRRRGPPISAVGLPPCSMSCSASCADGQAVLVAVVPLGHSRVEVPAVVVEARLRRPARAPASSEICSSVSESDHDVGHLHASVVDVVLHFDGRTAKTQHADQRVAKRRVAQVADMRRLVGVDGGVFDDGLALVGRAAGRGGVAEGGSSETRRDRESSSGNHLARASMRAKPSTAPSAVASSCAIARGALRSRRASSKATGTARSPNARLGA